MDIDKLIDLLRIASPSNFEMDFVNYLMTLKFDHFKAKLTPNGTLMFENEKTSDKPTILLDAHLDQVHYRIKKIMHDGIIVAQAVGFDSDQFIGVQVDILPFHKSKLGKSSEKSIRGVIVAYPPHLPTDGDISNPNYTYIDTGLPAKKLKELIIPGDPVMFYNNPQRFGDDSVMGQGLDDKIGVFILLQLMEYFDKNYESLKYHTIFNFSTREEIGNVSIDHVDDVPIDKMLIIDTDTAIDLPNMSDDELGSEIYCGDGPTISRNHDDSPILFQELYDLAEKNKIPIQITYTEGFGKSNAFEYVKFINSISQFIGIPIRSMHSPVETAKIIDIQYTFDLIRLYLSSI
jgi:putative aminopeptidase FrvX